MSSNSGEFRSATNSTSKTAVSTSSSIRIRSFGSLIDVNSPTPRLPIRSLASTIGNLQQNLPIKATLIRSPLTMSNKIDIAAGGVSCKKSSSNDVKSCELSKTTITPAKRKFNDENCESTQLEDSHQHRAKRKATSKKEPSTSEPVSPVKEFSNSQKSIQSLASTSISSQKTPLSIVQTELQPSASSNQTISPSSSPTKKPVCSTLQYTKEQQIKWITEPDSNNDPDYFMVLIEQRFKSLQKTWAENDRLMAEIEQLEQERDVLDPMFQKVIELKEFLLAEDTEQ